MPRKPRYRPPASAPPANAPGFDRWLLEQLRLIGEDLHGTGSSDVDTLIRQERLDLPAGATRRVSPTLSGTVVVLEAPSAENADQQSTLIIEDPRGSVTVSATPHIGADGKVTLSLINGERTATFSRSGVVVFYSNGIDQWKTVAESPAESGAIGATGPTGPTGPPGTGGALRQIKRIVYYADGEKETYDANNVLSSTVSSGTFTADDLGDEANLGRAWIVPSGSSGGSGFRSATSNNLLGGSGAGGPFVRDEWLDRAQLETYVGATVVVGAAPAAAAGIAAGVTNVLGNDGNTGNRSSFGDLIAFPGGGGKGGLATGGNIGGGTGGGSLGPGVMPVLSNNATGGQPANTVGQSGIGGAGAGSVSVGDATGIGSSGKPAEDGGASGGGAGVGTAANARGGHGGNAVRGGPGAGAGGSGQSANRAGGGNGGGRPTSAGDTAGSGAVGPAFAAGQGDGADGTDGADGDVLTCTLGMPGSGGAQALITSGSTSFTSGRGGHGGFPGGSSGGSGAGRVNGGTGNITIAPSGDPADGVVVLVLYG